MNHSEDLIYSYSSAEAEEDGFLVDITKINSSWEKGLFNYITTNLLSKGYMQEDKFNLLNLLDLLNQALNIVKKKSKNFKEYDSFFSGIIELPSGEKQKIFIEVNETEKFTIMLPEDR